MKKKWLMYILRFSSRIYRVKEKMAGSSIWKTVFFALEVVVLELYLLVVSIPAYIFIEPDSFGLKIGASKGEITQYHLRKMLAISTLLGIVFVWVLMEFGSGGLANLFIFQRSNIGGGSISGISTEAVPTAPFSIDEILMTSDGRRVDIGGRGAVNREIVLFVSSDPVLVYHANTDAKGNWRITHNQNAYAIPSGRFRIYAMSADALNAGRSGPIPAGEAYLALINRQ